MSKKFKRAVLLSVAVLAVGLANSGCPSSGDITVDEVVEHQTEAVATGPACAYGLAISNEIQHRLNHYRICTPKAGQEQKQADALQNALNDCFGLCEETFGSESDEGITCVAQCNAE